MYQQINLKLNINKYNLLHIIDYNKLLIQLSLLNKSLTAIQYLRNYHRNPKQYKGILSRFYFIVSFINFYATLKNSYMIRFSRKKENI